MNPGNDDESTVFRNIIHLGGGMKMEMPCHLFLELSSSYSSFLIE